MGWPDVIAEETGIDETASDWILDDWTAHVERDASVTGLRPGQLPPVLAPNLAALLTLADVVAFVDEVGRRRDAVAYAVEGDDHVELARASSDLQHAATTVGAATLAGLCQRLERRAHDGLLSDALVIAVEIAAECSWVTEALLALGERRPTPSS